MKERQLITVECVEYYDRTRYVLFKCDWAGIKKYKGYKEDEYGLTLVNFKNLIHMGERINNDMYVLSSQVCYIEDGRNPNWSCVVRTKARNMYDVDQRPR